jgi:glucose-1-phosphatase
MPVRRPALIFDFGNVVAFFDFTRACDRWGPGVGLSGQALLERVRGAGFTPLLQDYERGAMVSHDFARAFCELAGLSVAFEDFAPAWSDIFRLNEPVAGLVGRLKGEGYTLVLGSNTNELHATRFRDQFAETLRHFDALVLSYEVRHIKPSAGFYLACATAAGAEPAECVFIDDMPENVEGARSAGLSGVLYRDTPDLIRELHGLGVEVEAD